MLNFIFCAVSFLDFTAQVFFRISSTFAELEMELPLQYGYPKWFSAFVKRSNNVSSVKSSLSALFRLSVVNFVIEFN